MKDLGINKRELSAAAQTTEKEEVVKEEEIKEGRVTNKKGDEAIKVEETVGREREERQNEETRVSKRKGDDIGRVKHIHDADHGAATTIAIVGRVVVVARVDTLVFMVAFVVSLAPSNGDDKSICIFETADISIISTHLSSLVESSRLASRFCCFYQMCENVFV